MSIRLSHPNFFMRKIFPRRFHGEIEFCLKYLKFFYHQRIRGFEVPVTPLFEYEGNKLFQEQLSKSRFYLEFGSGGSTVLAAKAGKHFLSVDSDAYFQKAVKKAIGTLLPDQTLLHAQIGMTGPWGYPLFQKPTPSRTARWSQYPETAWAYLRETGRTPDLILIDGRFRVLTALTCIKYLSNSDWTLLVDDYTVRPEYQEIEAFAKLSAKAGRMAAFSFRPYNMSLLDKCMEQYKGIPD